MERNERSEYAEMKAEELREQEARIAAIEARARAEQAQEAIEELSGLKRVKDSVKQRLQTLSDQNTADWEQVRADVEASSNRLRARLREVGDRLDKMDIEHEKKLDAEFDEMNAKIDRLEARVAQEYLGTSIEIQEAMDELKKSRAAAKRERRAVGEARKEARHDVRESFKRSVENLKQSFRDASDKVEAARAREQQQPHA